MIAAKQALVEHGAWHAEVTPPHPAALPHDVRLPQEAVGPRQQLLQHGLAPAPRLLRLVLRGHIHQHADQVPLVRSGRRDHDLLVHPERKLVLDDMEFLFVTRSAGENRLLGALIHFRPRRHILFRPESAVGGDDPGVPEPRVQARGGQVEIRPLGARSIAGDIGPP